MLNIASSIDNSQQFRCMLPTLLAFLFLIMAHYQTPHQAFRMKIPLLPVITHK